MLFGALLFGNLSDRFGRRVTLQIAVLGLSFFSFIAGLVTSFTLYAVLRFAAGIFCGGGILVGRYLPNPELQFFFH